MNSTGIRRNDSIKIHMKRIAYTGNCCTHRGHMILVTRYHMIQDGAQCFVPRPKRSEEGR